MAGKSAILAVKIIGDAKGAVEAMGKTGLALGGLVVAAGAAALGVGKALYDIGAATQQMDDTIRVGTGASGEALAGLQDSARNVARTVPADFDAVGTTVADLNTRLGLTGDNLETVSAQVLEAGRMLGEDIDIQSLSGSLNGFNVEAGETEGALDDLFRVSQATGVSMNDLTGTMSSQAAVLDSLGLSFGESAALIGVLDKAGINSNQVINGMGRSLTKLAKDGEAPADAFNRTVGEMQAFIDAGDEASALDLASEVFGTRAAPQFISALQSGKVNMDDLMASTGATSDTILGLGDETMHAAEHWQVLKNNAMLALEPIASLIFGAVGDAFGYFAGIVQGIDFTPVQEFADRISAALPGIVEGFIGAASGAAPFGDILAQVSPVLAAIGVSLLGLAPSLMEMGSTLFPILVSAAAGIIPVFAQIAGTIVPPLLDILARIIPVVTEIAAAVIPALVSAFQTIVPEVLKVVPPLMGFANSILDTVIPAVQFLLPIIINIFGSIVTQIQGAVQIIVNVLNLVVALLMGDWAGAWEAIKGIVGGAITFVKGVIQQGMSIAAGLMGTSVETMKTKATEGFRLIVSTVQTKIGELVGKVRALPGQIKSALGNLGSLLVQAGKDLIQGMINGIGSMGQALKNKASNLAGGAVDAIKGKLGIASPSKVLQQIGEWTGEGFVKGVDRLQRDAAGAMTDLVEVPDVPTIPLSVTGSRRDAAGAARPLEVHVHIEGAFVGDELSLAREIQRLLTQRRDLIGAPA